MRRRVMILLELTVILLAAPPARATVVIGTDLSELTRSAHVIVQGRVVEVTPQWTQGRRRIESLVAVEVVSYLKGNLGPRVVCRVPGGQIGRYRSMIVGAPSFREGDEVVLFLVSRGPSIPAIVGLSQGVFRLVRDVQSGEILVVPPPAIAGTTSAEPVHRGDTSRRPMPIRAFVEKVRSLLPVAGQTATNGAQRTARVTGARTVQGGRQ
jgi:hypothetical protein